MQILVEAERIEYIQQEYDKQRNGWGVEYLGNYVQAGIASIRNMSGGSAGGLVGQLGGRASGWEGQVFKSQVLKGFVSHGKEFMIFIF